MSENTNENFSRLCGAKISVIGGGLALMIPGLWSDLAGLVLIGGVVVLQYLKKRRESAARL